MTWATPAVGLVTAGRVQTSSADPEGVYQIGSVSKVFTALLLALEVVEGRLTMKTPLGRLVPALGDRPVSEVTLEALVTHTSGLPRLPPGMWRRTFDQRRHNPYADYDESMLVASISGLAPRPTKRARYSNLGFGLLGTALARHLGTSYDEAVRDRISTPLGMTSTGCYPDAHVPGHSRRGRVRAHLWTFDALAGAGALWSSVDDLVVFARANLKPPEGSLGDAIRLTQQPLVGAGRVQQAMAWIKVAGRDGAVLWHNGGTAGFRSFVGVDVQRGRGAVVLGNSDRSVDKVGFRMLQNA